MAVEVVDFCAGCSALQVASPGPSFPMDRNSGRELGEDAASQSSERQ